MRKALGVFALLVDFWGQVVDPTEVVVEGFLPNVADIGGWGLFVALALFIVFSVVKGVLVPMSTVQHLRDQANKTIESEKERADGYKEAAENSQLIIERMNTAQADALQQQVEASTRILEALQKLGEDSDV